MITFKIDPQPKPRLVRSDTWANRPIVNRYWTYKDMLNIQAKKLKYEIGNDLNIRFYIAMPKSWSEKKKKERKGWFHRQVPDLDNLCKGFLDCLTDDDSEVSIINAMKQWAYEGRIEVY